MARFMRSDLGSGHSQLHPPRVVNAYVPPALIVGPNVTLAVTLLRSANKRRRQTMVLPPYPVAIGDSIVWYGPGTKLAPPETGRRQRPTYCRLSPPAVVIAAQTAIFFGPRVTLNVQLPVQRRERVTKRSPDYELKPPVVIGTSVMVVGIRALYTKELRAGIRRRVAHSILRKPVVLVTPGVFFGPKTTLTSELATQRRNRVTRRSPDYELKPPAVIGGGIRFSGLYERLALAKPHYIRRISRLRPPAVTQANVTYAPIAAQLAASRRGKPRFFFRGPTIGSGITFRGPIAFLADSRRGRAKPRLSKPAHIQVDPNRPVDITNAAVQQRRSRIPRAAHPKLQPPAVVGAGIYFRGPFTHIVRIRPRPATIATISVPPLAQAPAAIGGILQSLAPSRRPIVKSLLRGAITTVEPVVTTLSVNTTYSRRGKPRSTFVFPYVVLVNAAFGGIGINLVRIRPPAIRSKLRPPAVLQAVVVLYFGPQTNLVRGRRPVAKSTLHPAVIPPLTEPTRTTFALARRPKPKSRLARPVVVYLAVEISGPETTLAYSLRKRGVSELKPPADITEAEEFPVLRLHLAYSRRGRPIYRLEPPVVVFLAVEIYGPEIALTRIAPPPTISHLFPPADVTEAEEFPIVREHLTYSRRGVAKSRLQPPIVVLRATEIYGPAIELAPSFRGRPTYFLSSPTDTVGLEDQGKVVVHLAPSKRGQPKSRLIPPAVVGAGIVYRPVRVELTYSRRGTPKSAIFPGLVGRDVYSGPVTNLTYSRRGKPIYFLRAPQVINRPLARAIQIFLAPQARGVTRSILRPAIIPPLAEPTRVELAPSFRGTPKSRLEPPAVVRSAIEIYGPVVELAYSRRGRPQYRLEPPVVVGREVFFGPAIGLAPQFRGTPLYKVRPPVVVRVFVAPPVQVHLARIQPPKRFWRLSPPAVVGAGLAFFGPKVHLTRIKPPKVIHFTVKAFEVEEPFIPPQGHVCGFDIAGSFICFTEEAGSGNFGSDQAGSSIQGTTGTTGSISGGDRAGGNVSGGDRPAE